MAGRARLSFLTILFSKFCLLFAILVQNSPTKSLIIFRNFSNLYGEDQHLSNSQISWNFATNIFLKISENDFREVRKQIEKS